MLAVWVDDRPLSLQAGELVMCEGAAYRALQRVSYALPECNPCHPQGCEWFALAGACD